MNRRDRDFISVQEARITPLGQSANSNLLTTPLMVAQRHIHFISVAHQSEMPSIDPTGPLRSPEFVVQKRAAGCYVLTDTFAIYGQCHILPGSSLDNLLDTADVFVSVTNATIYLNTPGAQPWHRDFVMLNKEKVQVMYLLETKPQTVAPEEKPDPPTSPLKSLLS